MIAILAQIREGLRAAARLRKKIRALRTKGWRMDLSDGSTRMSHVHAPGPIPIDRALVIQQMWDMELIDSNPGKTSPLIPLSEPARVPAATTTTPEFRVMTQTYPNRFAAIVAGAFGYGGIATHAAQLAATAQNRQEALVLEIKNKVFAQEAELVRLTDFGPATTYDIKPGGSFNAATWANEYHAAAFKLKKLKEELEVAEETAAQFFGTQVVVEVPAVPPAAPQG